MHFPRSKENKIKGITIDRESGEIYIFDKLKVNLYNITINYNLNNVISSTQIDIIVNPTLDYIKTEYELLYDTNFLSIKPLYTPYNGEFTIDNEQFSINSEGVVSSNTILKVNNYTIKITYEVNNINVSTYINLKITPIFKYKETYNFLYNKLSFIYPIIINPQGGYVKCNILPNNIFLDETTGIITITENCLPNNYMIDLSYIINNIEIFINFKIIIDIYINFNIDKTITHNQKENILLSNFTLPIKYSIQNTSNNFVLNNNILEIFSRTLNKKINLFIEFFQTNYFFNIFKIIFNKRYSI